jgi:hypothetical protein
MATPAKPTDNSYPTSSVVQERMAFANPVTWATTLADAAERLGTLCSSYVAAPQLDVRSSVDTEFRAARPELVCRRVAALSQNNAFSDFQLQWLQFDGWLSRSIAVRLRVSSCVFVKRLRLLAELLRALLNLIMARRDAPTTIHGIGGNGRSQEQE